MVWLPKRRSLQKSAHWLGFDAVFLGLRRAESLRRGAVLDGRGPIEQMGGLAYINPIIDWSDDDVWDYIMVSGLDYSPVYDRLAAIGVSRHRQRVGGLESAPGEHIWKGWPQTYIALIRRYGLRWTRPGQRRYQGMDPLVWLDIKDALDDATR